MNKNKIGTIFLVSVLALAGVGISYAGLTDTLNVYGTVSTGTVDLVVDSYSGTWVWKVWGTGIVDEVIISHDKDFVPDPSIYPNSELVAWAAGRDADYEEPVMDPYQDDGSEYNAVIEFNNLFPCIDFSADVVFHYVGSIPALLSYDWGWSAGPLYDEDGMIIFSDWIQWLINNGHMTYTFNKYNDQTSQFDIPISQGYQLHYCDLIKVEVTIHLPQENFLQGLTAQGYFNFNLVQWTDPCNQEEDEFDIEITKIASTEEPEFGVPFTYTITAENLGPGDATGVVVNDLLAVDIDYISHTASQGTYDHTTGVWNIGALMAGETATLTITVEIPAITQTEYTQLTLLIDGSGSIIPADWTLLRNGIALAITNGYIPHNGHVELTVIQFGGWTNQRSWAQVELGGPIVLDGTNYLTVASNIENIVQLGGGTAMSCAFRLAADVMSGDPNGYLTGTPFAGMASTHSDWPRQVINLVTDGRANIEYIHAERYAGSWWGLTPPEQEFVLGRASTEAALAYYKLLMPIGTGDEIDIEAVGAGTNLTWLTNYIATPQPGYTNWPPTGPGWVRHVDTFTEMANTLQEKFQIIFQQIENCATLYSPVDINPSNNEDCVVVIPQ